MCQKVWLKGVAVCARVHACTLVARHTRTLVTVGPAVGLMILYEPGDGGDTTVDQCTRFSRDRWNLQLPEGRSLDNLANERMISRLNQASRFSKL